MANSEVHTGFWIDHSRGLVLGATLTFDAGWGSQLVSAAALLVQIIGSAVWTIIAFAIHQSRAVPGLRDEYDAQLQVLLRNTQAADSTAWSIFQLGRTWRGRKQYLWRSAAPLTILPAIVYAGFLVAGVFVGQIATNSYDHPNVLLKPGACGFASIPNSKKGTIGYNNLSINVTSIAKQYSRSCYSGAGSLSAVSCDTYTVPSLQYKTYFNESCPVPGRDACFPPDDQSARPIRLVTAPLDSHYDLGINAPPGQRLRFQYQTSCAPLSYSFVDSFTTSRTMHNNDSSFGTPPNHAKLKLYQFGEFDQFDANLTTRFYYAPIIRYYGVGNIGYTVNAARSLVPHGNTTLSEWLPVAPLNQTTSDLSLFMLTPNSIVFVGPVEDPMFRTSSSPDPIVFGGANYVAMRDAYFMACTEDYQICNPSNNRCTGWVPTVSLADYSHWYRSLNLNDEQQATYIRLASNAWDNPLTSATNGQPDSLLAQASLLSATGSRKLPKNQWQLEVRGWFEIALARIQIFATVFPQMPLELVHDSNIEFLSAATVSKALAQQCKQQRVTAPQQYQSYNLFALLLIAILAIVVPGITVIVRSSHARLWHINPKGYRYLSYQGEGLMHLHRMVMEGSGYDGWEGGITKTPRTAVAEDRIPQVALDDDGEGEPFLRYPRRGRAQSECMNGHLTRGDHKEVPKDDDSYSALQQSG